MARKRARKGRKRKTAKRLRMTGGSVRQTTRGGYPIHLLKRHLAKTIKVAKAHNIPIPR